MQTGFSVDRGQPAQGNQQVTTRLFSRILDDRTVPFCATTFKTACPSVPMKPIIITLLASLVIPSAAFAEGSQVHAFIGSDQMKVKVTTLDVILSSNLEGMQVNDSAINGSGTFMLRCGNNGKNYVMISVPTSNDVWPTQSEDLHTKADVVAFGSDLEITGADLLSTKVSSERVMYIGLGKKVSEFARHWGTGMSVRFSAHPSNGLSDLSFIVAAPVPDADTQVKMAKAVAFCQIFAR